jgi:phage terminase Nu1 subunit (DNA packaging protein)
MGNEDNNATLGKNIHERLSLAECELLCTLARGVPVGQAIVSLSGGEDEVATWLARGANEVTDGKVHMEVPYLRMSRTDSQAYVRCLRRGLGNGIHLTLSRIKGIKR